MKLDKDFLIKQKFWVVLGGGVFLTLLAIFFLVAIAPGAIGKKRKQVEDDWGKVKSLVKDPAAVKNPVIITVVEKLRESEKGNEEVAWRRGYLSQKGLPFWPREFENQFEFEHGLFATEIAVQATADLAAQPADEPKDDKDEKKQDKNGKKEGPAEQIAKGKFHGKLLEFNSEYIVVAGRGKAGTKKFHRLRDEHMKVTIPEGKDASLFPELANKKGSVVAVSYFQGRRFYDPLTRPEQSLFAETYKSQLMPILKEAGPLNEMDQVLVQFPNYKWGKEPPQAEAPFFRHVKEWDIREKDISEEVWLAQEDLWIQRELFRIVKKANDSIANFEPVLDASKKPLPGRFVNPYWQIDVLAVKGDDIKIKLTNRLERPQPVHVNFRVQFEQGGPFVPIAPVKDNEPLAPAGATTMDGKPRDSIEREVKIESEEPGKQVVGVRQVLTWETAAVRRIDHVSIGHGGGDEYSLSQRNSFRKLRAFVKKKAEEKPAGDANAANPMDKGPGGRTGGAMIPGGPQGGVPGGGLAEGLTEFHKLVADRYFAVTPQARRIPVAVVLIVDQAQVSRVATAFADSPLRFLINQVLLHRYPRSVRPDASGELVAAEPGSGSGPAYPMSPLMPSSTGRYPGSPGRAPSMPMPIGPSSGGRPRMPMTPGGGMSYPGSSYPGMGKGMTYPGMSGSGYGYGAQPPSAGGNEEPESNVEMVLYGIISLYEPYPPRPPLPGSEGTPAPAPAPAANP